MDELSQATDEQDLQARENLLDLRITTASLERTPLVSILGGREIMPSQVRTFLSVDFYNHDSKYTDQAEGFESVYNTLFSFRNCVDDFYLQHCEREFINVDVYVLPITSTDEQMRPSGVIKIGTAKLPLFKLLEQDISF